MELLNTLQLQPYPFGLFVWLVGWLIADQLVDCSVGWLAGWGGLAVG